MVDAILVSRMPIKLRLYDLIQVFTTLYFGGPLKPLIFQLSILNMGI